MPNLKDSGRSHPASFSPSHVLAPCSLDMHWTLQITLLNPRGLEIQNKQSWEGRVWPHRQDEQEMHCMGTAALHICPRWARQHPPASTAVSYIFMYPSVLLSFPAWSVRVWCHFKLHHSGTSGPGNRLPDPATERGLSGLQDLRSTTLHLLLQSLLPKRPKYFCQTLRWAICTQMCIHLRGKHSLCNKGVLGNGTNACALLPYKLKSCHHMGKLGLFSKIPMTQTFRIHH